MSHTYKTKTDESLTSHGDTFPANDLRDMAQTPTPTPPPEKLDFLDQILLGTNEYINEAYLNLMPLLAKHQPCPLPDLISRSEKQWILMYSSTFVEGYKEYVIAHCRPSIGGLHMFLVDATRKWLLGLSADPLKKCNSPADRLYPSYYHIFVEASSRWLARWDPFGDWEAEAQRKETLTTARSNSSGA